jgi:hypothetical protein
MSNEIETNIAQEVFLNNRNDYNIMCTLVIYRYDDEQIDTEVAKCHYSITHKTFATEYSNKINAATVEALSLHYTLDRVKSDCIASMLENIRDSNEAATNNAEYGRSLSYMNVDELQS